MMHLFFFLTTGGSNAATIACVIARKASQYGTYEGHDTSRTSRKQASCVAKKGTYLVENVLQSLLRQGRALHVLHRAQLSCEPFALLWGDRPLLLPRQLLQHLRIVPEIDLCSDDEARNTGTVMVNFGEPLLLHVLE